MTKLALGTAQFGQEYGILNASGQIKKSEVLKIIKSAKEKNRFNRHGNQLRRK